MSMLSGSMLPYRPQTAASVAAAAATAVPARTAPGQVAKLPGTAGDPLVPAGSVGITGDAGFVLTGSITPDGTTTATIVGEAAVVQIKAGDRITINATTRTVIAKSGSVLTLDGTVPIGAADTTPDVLPCIEALVTSAGVLRYVVRSDGRLELRNGATLLLIVDESTGIIDFGEGHIGQGYGLKLYGQGSNYPVHVTGYGLHIGEQGAVTPGPGGLIVDGFTKRSVEDAKTAIGTVQGDAYAIVSDTIRFTTVGSGTGARLSASAWDCMVFNRGANAILVYPETSSSIDGGSVNAAISLASNGVAGFRRLSATTWERYI